MVWLLKFNIVILLLLMTLLLLMYRNKVEQIETYIELISNQEKTIQFYKSTYDTLKIYSHGDQTYKNSQKNSQYDNDIKEAVKYAMKKSHPDNGGSNEDFDKFRKLFERIK